MSSPIRDEDDDRLDQAMAAWSALPVPECPDLERLPDGAVVEAERTAGPTALPLSPTYGPVVPTFLSASRVWAAMAVCVIAVMMALMIRHQEEIADNGASPVAPVAPTAVTEIDIALTEQSPSQPGLVHRTEIQEGTFDMTRRPGPPPELAQLQSELRDLAQRLKIEGLRDRTDELLHQLQRMVAAAE